AVPGHAPSPSPSPSPLAAPTPAVKSAAELSTYGMGRAILHARGPLGLFYGFTSHLIRESLGGAVYFSSYELSKHYLSPADGSPPNVLVHVAAGGICGLFAWTIIFPTDSIKSTIQKEALAHGQCMAGAYGRVPGKCIDRVACACFTVELRPP
ncbi:mitochondrial carrier domain-containing protein, partial [Catenaria anguillulae PL171]